MGKGRKNSMYQRYKDTLVTSKRLSNLSNVDKEVEVLNLEESANLANRASKAKLKAANAKLNEAMAAMIETSMDKIISGAAKQTAKELAKQAVKG